MTYRKVSLADLDALVDLEEMLFDADSFAMDRRTIRYHINKARFFEAAFDGDQLAGYLLAFIYKKSVRIYAIGVSPAFQKRGIAKTMIGRLVSLLAGRLLYLEVRADNVTAIRAYESMGFSKVSIKNAYYPDGMDAWRMEKSA